MDSSTLFVLLVEDDPAHARVVKRAFKAADTPFEVEVTCTLTDAQAVISERRPDVVITDLVLPDGRGTALLPEEDESPFPVVVLTSHGDEQVAVQALKMGAFDYVVKTGLTLLELPRVAQRTFREWKLFQKKREAEREIRENEQRLRSILDAIPDLLLVLSRSGEILDCRGARGANFQVDAATLVGRNIYDLVKPRVFEDLLRKFEAVLTHSVPETAECEVNFDAGGYFAELRIVAYDNERLLTVIRDVSTRKMAEAKLNALSPREWEVLKAVAAGKPNKQIAQELDISIKTVEAHRSRLMKKVDADNMADLMRIALQIEELVETD